MLSPHFTQSKCFELICDKTTIANDCLYDLSRPVINSRLSESFFGDFLETLSVALCVRQFKHLLALNVSFTTQTLNLHSKM